jgi:multidrug efflux pump
MGPPIPALSTLRSSHWGAQCVSATQIINRLRPKLNRLPVASAFLQAVQDLRIGGRSGNAMYQYTIQSDTTQDLSKWGPILQSAMQHLPGLQDVSSDQQNGGLDEMMTYDRVTAAKLGLTAQSLDSALYGAFGQSEVSIIYTQLNQYYVVLEVAPQYWQSPEGLKDIYLLSSGGSKHSAARGGQGPGQHHTPGRQPYGLIPLRHRVL